MRREPFNTFLFSGVVSPSCRRQFTLFYFVHLYTKHSVTRTEHYECLKNTLTRDAFPLFNYHLNLTRTTETNSARSDATRWRPKPQNDYLATDMWNVTRVSMIYYKLETREWRENVVCLLSSVTIPLYTGN